jgi:hypothetical protein
MTDLTPYLPVDLVRRAGDLPANRATSPALAVTFHLSRSIGARAVTLKIVAQILPGVPIR